MERVIFTYTPDFKEQRRQLWQPFGGLGPSPLKWGLISQLRLILDPR